MRSQVLDSLNELLTQQRKHSPSSGHMGSLLHHVATYSMCNLHVLHLYMSCKVLQNHLIIYFFCLKVSTTNVPWRMWEDAPVGKLNVEGGIKDVV